MPVVYSFAHTHSEIRDALVDIFTDNQGTVKEQWTTYAEIRIEPVGWDAVWKLSKRFCKKFDVRYPCVAIISVTSVDFEELTAEVEVQSVQHESVSLPEQVSAVPLIELWPTLKQKEKSVNAEETAQCIDLMRFFYDNIWMPWDDQDNKVMLSKSIENRMSLWLDLHNGSIPNYIARSITMLRYSAINAHEHLRELDSSMCDEFMADDDDSLLPSNYISQCAEMSAHLDSLMPKWSLYEDPLVREHYLSQAMRKWEEYRSRRNLVALWQGGNIEEFTNISIYLQSKATKEQNLMVMTSAEEALSLEPEKVIFCSNFYEIPELPLSRISLRSMKVCTVKASSMRSCLFTLSEECKIQDLHMSCALVNSVIVMRAGTLRLKNCFISDDSQDLQNDFAQGIVAMAGAKIICEKCTFENFYTGLVVYSGAQVELNKCVIRQCGVGIQMYSGANVKLDEVLVAGCTEQSIRCELTANSKATLATINGFEGKTNEASCAGDDTYPEPKMEGLEIALNCKIGHGNLQREVLIVKQDNDLA